MSKLIDRLAARAEAAMRAEMERLKSLVIERNSVPVGPNGQRSKPGEAPRKDTGDQVASAAAEIINATRSVKGSVSLSSRYILKLKRSGRVPFGPVLQDNKTATKAALRAGLIAR